jgi:predicted dehydrogenase
MLGYKSPNEKLNIASIGAGGKAASDIRACAATENIVALCDVDDVQAGRTFKQFEKTPKYKDFRKMLEKEGSSSDAVIVTIPDFMHATAAIHCMAHGKHVYVQKPLVRTVTEARMMTEAAAKYGVATQMGNQGYSNDGTRRCAEMIWAGQIGNVTEVHAWTNRPIWPQGLTEIPAPDAVPSTLDWDLWLGVGQQRPYTSGGPKYAEAQYKFYQPFNWRGFFDFGCGALGDMACHILGAPNMALKLGAPTSVECVKQEGKSLFMFPEKSVIRFDFPARGSMPPVKIFWYDGVKAPPFRPAGLENERLGDIAFHRPTPPPGQERPAGQRPPFVERDTWSAGPPPKLPEDATAEEWARAENNGSLFVGDKGFITTGTYGDGTRLVPFEKMKDYEYPPEMLTRSPGHYRDWIRACKGGEPSCSNFSVAAPFTEWVLLGVIALRVEGKLEWDSAKMRFTNNVDANKYLKPFVRKGWQIG